MEFSHPAIIPPEDWQLVQSEIERRKAIGRRYSGNSVFSSRIVCSDCGEFYGPKIWHPGKSYTKTIWLCNHKYSDGSKCCSQSVSEEQVKNGFITIINRLLANQLTTIEDCIIIRNLLSDCTAIDAEIEALAQEMQIVSELTSRCIDENSRKAQDQTEFGRRYNGLVKRYDTAKAKFDSLEEDRRRKQLVATRIDAFITQIQKSSAVLEEFDSKLWIAAIDSVVVYPDGQLVYRLVTGAELQA